MTLLYEEEVEVSFNFNPQEIATKVIEKALDSECFPYEAEVSLLLTDDEAIHQMNAQFREVDRSTDVLSFPMIDYPAGGDFSQLEEEPNIFNPESGEAMLGDIVISIEHVSAQATEYGHSKLREFAFLVAHSMFHLMGYDHMSEGEAKVMEAKQAAVLDELGINRS